MLSEPTIILVTGIMASGKSTVAQRLAERLPKSVHLRGDTFRRMIVNGEADISPPLSESATEQLRLRYRLAADAARTYCKAGFTVVYQDIVIGAFLAEVVEPLKVGQPLYVVMLCPTPETVAEREAGRHKIGYGDWTPADLDHELRANTARIGLWLDTSALLVDETVDTILKRLPEALI